MTTLETKAGRPAESRKRIVQSLRARIVDGHLKPGSRLPTRVELERHFGASPLTVQRALDKLGEDGFVRVNGRRGTFVADRPPHLSRYGVVYMQPVSDSRYSQRFFEALRSEVERADDSEEYTLPQFFDVNGHEDSEDYQRLLREVLANRVAGLIFTGQPYLLMNTPLLSEPDIPRVAIMDPDPRYACPVISTDTAGFLIRALDYFRSRGRTRVAFINQSGSPCASPVVLKALRERCLTTRDYWCQNIHLLDVEAARNCAHLLMHEGQRERPDALIINDDNLVEPATRGLLAAGISVPDDIEIVAHCNFPYPTPALVPATRLGYDTRQIVAACIQSIDSQRRGEKNIPEVTTISAIFESELADSGNQRHHA